VENVTVVEVATVQRIALSVARRYKSKCWWANLDDLVQEGIAAILKSASTFDAQTGIPFEGYAWKAAVYSIRMYLWQNTAPVNETWHNAKTLNGVSRVSLDSVEIQNLSDARKPIQESLDDLRWKKRVRDRISALLEDHNDPEFTAAILLGDKKPKQTHKDGIYGDVARARRTLSRDYGLYQLWREKD
jgi:DNA-directed RNA polymerase specialized sigma24 family protein